MNAMAMTQRVVGLVIVVFLSALSVSQAAVIFEDNFDSTADWNASDQYVGKECSPVGIASSVFTCASDTYPANWDAYRTVPGASGLHPVISIQRPPDNVDHTTGVGKAAVIWQESVSGANFPGDGIIMKKLNQDYNELYFQIWIKSNPNWQFNSEGYMKTLRVYHRGYTAGNWFDFFTTGQEPSPSWIMDPKWSSTYGWRHVDALRGAPDDGSGAFTGVCVDPGSFNGRATCIYGTDRIEQAWDLSNPMLNWKTPGQLLDGGWHKLSVRLKTNTKTGATWNNDGIYQMWLDDVQQVNATGLRWIAAGNAVGWNGFAIGGNANNTFNASTPSDQWYVIDDVVVSTNPVPADYVPGGGSTDTTPPAAPTRLRVQ